MQKIKYISFAVISFLLVSCGENFFDSIVEVEVPAHESNLAITAHLSNIDEVGIVHVTQTVGILDNQEIPTIKDAMVELYNNGTLFQTYNYFVLEEEPDVFGNNNSPKEFYIAENPKPLSPNTTYELRVSTPTFGSITATQHLAQTTEIINATFEKEGIGDGFGERGDKITIKFQDPAGEKNYYAVQAFGTYEYETGNGIETYENNLYVAPIDPSAEEVSNSLVLTDTNFDGKEYELTLVSYNYSDGLKEVQIVLYTITEDRYLYEKTFSQYQDNDGNPFAEPVIIHENISDGNGIFTMNAGDIFKIEI